MKFAITTAPVGDLPPVYLDADYVEVRHTDERMTAAGYVYLDGKPLCVWATAGVDGVGVVPEGGS